MQKLDKYFIPYTAIIIYIFFTIRCFLSNSLVISVIFFMCVIGAFFRVRLVLELIVGVLGILLLFFIVSIPGLDQGEFYNFVLYIILIGFLFILYSLMLLRYQKKMITSKDN